MHDQHTENRKQNTEHAPGPSPARSPSGPAPFRPRRTCAHAMDHPHAGGHAVGMDGQRRGVRARRDAEPRHHRREGLIWGLFRNLRSRQNPRKSLFRNLRSLPLVSERGPLGEWNSFLTTGLLTVTFPPPPESWGAKSSCTSKIRHRGDRRKCSRVEADSDVLADSSGIPRPNI